MGLSHCPHSHERHKKGSRNWSGPSEGINTRMLVKELKNLEATGVVNRRSYATVPPTVEYSLTEKGLAIEPILNEIERWAVEHF